MMIDVKVPIRGFLDVFVVKEAQILVLNFNDISIKFHFSKKGNDGFVVDWCFTIRLKMTPLDSLLFIFSVVLQAFQCITVSSYYAILFLVVLGFIPLIGSYV